MRTVTRSPSRLSSGRSNRVRALMVTGDSEKSLPLSQTTAEAVYGCAPFSVAEGEKVRHTVDACWTVVVTCHPDDRDRTRAPSGSGK